MTTTPVGDRGAKEKEHKETRATFPGFFVSATGRIVTTLSNSSAVW
ncbi:MAG: hypothetical protein GX489_03170 [Firmicutes bacterium]|nr:hypothetical protein [Bacillota bacterium]